MVAAVRQTHAQAHLVVQGPDELRHEARARRVPEFPAALLRMS